MSSSDSDTNYSMRRKPQRKQVQSSKKRPVSESENESSYSESEQSGSEHDDDEQYDDEPRDKPRMKEITSSGDKVVEKKGFSLPGLDEEPKIFVLCGSCASGKSHMLKYMMSIYGARKQFKFGMCYTSTGFTGDYSYLPKRAVREFSMEHLESYIKHLREKIVTGKAEHGAEWNLPHNFVIIDDSIGMVQNSGFFANFVATHRHTKTTLFMLSQQLTAARSVSTVLRANVSYAFCWPTAMHNVVDGLWKSFGQFYPKVADFKAALDACRSRKYSCLVFMNSPNHTSVEEAYTTICAPANIPEFELAF